MHEAREEQFEALRAIHTTIGASASSIIGNPEFNMSKLRDLVSLLNKTELGPFNGIEHRKTILEVQILIALTVAEVFEDIIPSYRIKQKQDEDDEKSKLSRDVIKLRQYERTFSAVYKNYLDYLKRMLDSSKRKPASTFYRDLIATTREDQAKLAEVAVECYGKLLVAHPHFNYRDQLIANLVESNAQTKHKKCAEIAHKHLGQALKNDKLGEVSLEVTSVICDLAKKRKLSLSAMLFKTLLELRLIDVKLADEDQKKKWRAEMERLAALKKKQSRKERKRCKKMKKLKKDMLESEAHVTTDQKLKYHKLILKKLFVTYFRLLKYHEELDGERRETKKFVKLLPPVLEGVSKFAHLIDVVICNDIFPLINRLLENRDITTNCKLHCLSTVFIIYKSLESELGRVDPEQFYKHFYVILGNIDAAEMTQQELKSLDDCIHLMLIKRAKQVSAKRYCAFIRRLLILAMNLPPASNAAPLFEAIRRLVIQKPNVTAIFDSSNCSDFGSGQWDIEVDDPDFSHAESSVAWELHMLRHHTDQDLREFALKLQTA